MKPSIGASMPSSVSNCGAEGREREEVEVVVVGLLGRLLAGEGAEEVHPGLLLDEQVGGVLPGPAEGRGDVTVVRKEFLPGGEHGGGLRVGPLLRRPS